MAQYISKQDLDLVFGTGSSGADMQMRALTSSVEFVRSQVQLGFSSAKAKGRRFTAAEALRLFGWETLLKVANEGSAPLVTHISEPSHTIRSRRMSMNLERQQLSKKTGISVTAIDDMETQGKLCSIRDIDTICQHLSLDENKIGIVPGANSDDLLGIRLRELTTQSDTTRFTPNTVLALSEAAWVIRKQYELGEIAGSYSSISEKPNFEKDNDYSHPAWKQGFRLAAQTRKKLGIDHIEPIYSLRKLIEDRLEYPLIQQKIDPKFAGATLSNGSFRGIIVNEEGNNSNVWIRRMTLCHELGHLLWDPENKLNRLKVDEYRQIENLRYGKRSDNVEVRANAFAIAFLAPPEAVKALYDQCKSVGHTLASMMHLYGISMTAAKWHLSNVCNVDTDGVYPWELPYPTDDWIGRENFATDWFPAQSTPLSRRGRFAWITSLALKRRKISIDTASTILKVPPHDVMRCAQDIIDTYST